MSDARQPALSLRPVTPDDEPFLRELHAESRAHEMDATGWSKSERTAFCGWQFDAQQRSYRQQYPCASFDVVLADGEPVGRLYVARGREAVTVVEITLLAACRRRGWGTILLRGVIEEANRPGLPVRLRVDANNCAQQLYRRLGFRETGRAGFRVGMERSADPPVVN